MNPDTEAISGPPARRTSTNTALRNVSSVETVKLYGIGLPFMIAGIWIGFRLYGTIDDETFRKAVLVLVLLAGGPLIASVSGFMPW